MRRQAVCRLVSGVITALLPGLGFVAAAGRSSGSPQSGPVLALTQTVRVFLGNAGAITVSLESGLFTAPRSGPVEVELPPDTSQRLTVSGRVRRIGSPPGCVYGGYTLSTAAPTVTHHDTPTATNTPAEFVSCAVVGDPARAPNFPLQIAALDKGAETVTLRNVGAAAVDLAGWRMCSVTGGRQHPIGGALAPGEQRVFAGAGGPIWNNINSDPGALWSPAGQLVSYWPD